MQEHERGSIIVIVALMMVVLLGLSALVVDVGMIYGQQRKFQNAVNAAAFAGGQALPDTSAATTAANSNIQANGYSISAIAVTYPTGTSTIKVVGTQTVNYVFARVLGFASSTIVLNAAATKSAGAPAAFNYAIFSGTTSNLSLNTPLQVNGSVHANGPLQSNINGNNFTVTGSLEVSNNSIPTGSSVHIGTPVPNAPNISMPADFSPTILAEAGTPLPSQTWGAGYNADLTTKPLYINGNLTVNGDATFKGSNTVVVTGTVIFNDGCDLKRQTTSNALCIYSKTGDIYFNGNTAVTIEGLIYAPNGTVYINPNNFHVTGGIIAKAIVSNSTGLVVTYDPNVLNTLPMAGGVKLIMP